MGLLTCILLFVSKISIAAITISPQQLQPILNPTPATNQMEEPKRKLLYFWATWCPDCKDSIRHKLPSLPSSSVVLVNVDREKDRAEKFIQDEKLQLSVIRDEDKILRKRLSLFSVPSWAVIEKNGSDYEVVFQSSGSDFNQMQDKLKVVKP